MLQTLKVNTNDLTTGMFVSGLDRPWLGTPFLTQGFLLESDNDISRVRDFFSFVYIDTHKSRYISPTLGREAGRGIGNERPRIPVSTIFKFISLTL